MLYHMIKGALIMQIRFIFIILSFLWIFFYQLLWAQEGTVNKSSSSSSSSPDYFVQDGWYVHNEKGFKIRVPDGYLVEPPPAGTSAMFRYHKEVKKGSLQYKPYLSVLTFARSTSIDKDSFYDPKAAANSYKIKLQYEEVYGIPGKYEIMQESIITVKSGRDAMLIYARFPLPSTNILQAHLIMSGENRTYQVTFTDMEATFEENFNAVYPFLVDMDFEGEAPSRPTLFGKSLPFVLVILITIGGTWYFTLKRSKEELAEHTAEPVEVGPIDKGLGTVTNDFSGEGPGTTSSDLYGGSSGGDVGSDLSLDDDPGEATDNKSSDDPADLPDDLN